ncbi:MAG: hypothetical protein LBD03_09600 [Methanobrevibacter sp.]|jgi:hypothetical protein|nr:hypothetical protein [Candidatus Methanovirga procula]
MVEKLGLVDVERFIDSIKLDEFDYTEWKRDLWKDKSMMRLMNWLFSFQKEKNKNK